jgi:glycosyltransferase involved in cell wall biosynthesis
MVGRKAVLLVSNDLSHPGLASQQLSFSWRINRLRSLGQEGYEIVVVSAGGRTGRGFLNSLRQAAPRIDNLEGIVVLSPPVPRLPMVWFLPSMLLSPIMAMMYCRARNLNVEVIMGASVIYGCIARAINLFLHASLVVDYGDPDYVRERSLSLRFLKLLEKIVLVRPGVDVVTCIDPTIGIHLQSLGVRKYAFLPPGGFWKGEVRKGEVRKETPKGDGGREKVVLYAGHVAPPPTYRLDLLVEAAPIVLKEHPETKFIVVGDGSFADRMKVRARQLGVAERFEFTGGVPFSQAKAFMGRADVCVQLLNDMCLGTKVVDYFALGKPVLSCGRFYDQYHEFLKNGENCILVPPSPASIAEGLNRLLSDDQLRKRLGEKAFETVQGWDWEAQARMLQGLISEGHG